MKYLFIIALTFTLFAGTTQTANAQYSLKFTDNSNLALVTQEAFFASSEPISHGDNSSVLTTAGSVRATETEMCTPLQFKYALILNREVENISNNALFSFIDTWYGTRYRYGGSTKKGIDCSSLTSKLLKEVYNIEIPRTARQQYAATEKISGNEMAEGDLVFFNTRGGISHVGVFLGDGYFVHSSSSSGVMISHLDDNYFKNRFIGARRVMVTNDCPEL